MSTIIMSQCWPLQMGRTEKSVLISLADNANDQGVCWPAVDTIAMRCCLSDRAVQKAMDWLEAHGLISRQRKTGRSTVYTVTPGNYQAPEKASKKQPPNAVHPNRKEPTAEPSGNRQGAPARKAKTEKPVAGFDAVWAIYPRKEGKADAEKAFRKLAPDAALLADILAAIERQKASPQWREDGGKFVPHCSTWLNGKRWQDEAMPEAADGGTGGTGSDDPWWRSVPGIEAMGQKLEVAHKPHEEFWRYKARVYKKAGEGKWREEMLADMLRTKNIAYAAVYQYFHGHPPVEGQV